MKPEGFTTARPDADLVDFPELFRTFNRYKWGVIGIAVLATCVAALVAVSLRPLYQGSATILIEPRAERPVAVQDVYDPGYDNSAYFSTQYALLSSRALAEKVIDKLHLQDRRGDIMDDPDDSGDPVLDLRRWLPFLPVRPQKSATELETLRREALISAFMERVSVEPLRRTQLVIVHFDSFSPELSAEVANTLADLYIESGLQSRLDATRKATEWLTNKLADIKTQLEKSEAALQEFREKEQIVNVGNSRSLSESELVDYNQRFRDVQKRRQELQNAADRIRLANNDARKLKDISVLMQDPLVQRANTAVLEAQEAYRALQERYGARHPQMATAQARLDTAQAALAEQLRIAAAGVRTEYEIALQNERAMEQQVQSARSQLQNLDRKDYQLSVLQRDVTTNRELYDTFLTRFKETDTAGTFEALDARVVDPAVVPVEPYKPEKKKIVAIAAAGGLLLGLLLALLRHLLSEDVRSAEDLESVASLPVYGVLPLVNRPFLRPRNLAKAYMEHSRSPFSEGIRSLRAGLQLADADKRYRRLMVTSSVPKEGKSSVSSSLALAFGSIENVVLVDCDLRLPALSKMFEFPPGTKGVIDILAGRTTLDQCLLQFERGSIAVLPAGSPVSNPSELLNSPALEELLRELSARFDRVIIDTPPCQAASDTLLISSHVDAVLFVVKSEATSRRAIKNSLKNLRYAQAPLIGTVINQIDTRRNRAYQEGYYYAYGYYG